MLKRTRDLKTDFSRTLVDNYGQREDNGPDEREELLVDLAAVNFARFRWSSQDGAMALSQGGSIV
jgi:hypothetical protein